MQAWERLLKAASAHFQNMHPQATIKAAGKEGLLGLPPGKLPPPLQASDGGFTLDTLVRRVPAILRETLQASQAPPALAAAVEAQLCGPLAGGALLPPPRRGRTPKAFGCPLLRPALQAPASGFRRMPCTGTFYTCGDCTACQAWTHSARKRQRPSQQQGPPFVPACLQGKAAAAAAAAARVQMQLQLQGPLPC